jgi:4-alpha-glucanotransferase
VRAELLEAGPALEHGDDHRDAARVDAVHDAPRLRGVRAHDECLHLDGEGPAALERDGIEDADPWWALIRLAFASPGVVAMVQLQDVLGLGGEGRMNVPGLVDERNWSWRLEPGALRPELAARLREATAEAGRLPPARGPTGRSGPGSAR